MTSNPFHNLGAAELADRLGDVRAEAAALARQEAALKAEIRRRSITSARGERFLLETSAKQRSRLDTTAVRRALGEDWIKQHTLRALVYEIRTHLREHEKPQEPQS